MKIVDFFHGDTWMEYKVLYKNRTTKYVSFFNGKIEKIGGIKLGRCKNCQWSIPAGLKDHSRIKCLYYDTNAPDPIVKRACKKFLRNK